MSFDQTVNDRGSPRVLVAPLDWGLGHATRCIPVIYELISQGAAVWLAGEGATVVLLKKEFPQLPVLPLTGYRVRYANSRNGLFWSVITQVPSILRSIKNENEWLKKAVDDYGFDAVISDNRYGLHHTSIPSIFITHQLQIKSPFGKVSESLLQKKNYRYIEKFSECWVPDIEHDDGFAGELSHPRARPDVALHYAGILSRLKRLDIEEKKDHLFISLSGPEPQRSRLEDRVINDVSRYGGTAVIVRGLPAASKLIPSSNDLVFYNHLPSSDYNLEMQKAAHIISRSGYSTIMDLARVEKKSVLIPTPGQTEQEYLAAFMEKKKYAGTIAQKNFSLDVALNKANDFKYQMPAATENKLATLVASILKKISSSGSSKTIYKN